VVLVFKVPVFILCIKYLIMNRRVNVISIYRHFVFWVFFVFFAKNGVF